MSRSDRTAPSPVAAKGGGDDKVARGWTADCVSSKHRLLPNPCRF
jgi:hypothetical protein